MNPERKWDFLFRSAADPEYTTAKNFWEKEVKDNVNAYSSYRKTFSQVTADGAVLDNRTTKLALTHNTNSSYGPYKQYSAQREAPSKGFGQRQAPYKDQNNQHQAHHQDPTQQPQQPIKGQVCRDFNEGRDGHRDTWYCPEGRLHLCSSCGHTHPLYLHHTPKGKDTSGYKGKGKNKSTDKGGGNKN
jgi:hypothetical protein